MGNAGDRHNAIRDIVRTQTIRTQNELVALLKRRGIRCTQATVSRDITELHLRKLAEGYYILEEDLNLQFVLSEFVVDAMRAEGLIVVHTQPDTAGNVASAIDGAHLEHVLGTIAGTNTVFVATDSKEGGNEVYNLIMKLGTIA